MRLTPHEIAAIKTAAAEAFGADAVVRLFGSRVRDDLRGGDIDLLIEVAPGHAGIARETRFESVLFRHIDEQKVDLVIVERGTDPGPFARMVSRDAVLLQ
ncbi:MAG: nucleotidyltransferase domain-containing protein [Sphingomonas fennica]